MCIRNHENGCPAVQQWLSTMYRAHLRLIRLLWCVMKSEESAAVVFGWMNSEGIGGTLIRISAMADILNEIILKDLHTSVLSQAKRLTSLSLLLDLDLVSLILLF